MKLTITILILFFLLAVKISFCQEEVLSVIDSLELELSQEKEAENKIKLLNQLFDKQYPTNYKKALDYAHHALILSTNLKSDDKKVKGLISKSANNVGAGYLLLDQYEQSLKYLLVALKNAEIIQDTNRMSNALYNIGFLYDLKGETTKGLSYVKKAAEIDEEQGNLKSAGISYSSIAADYFFDGEYDEGMNYYEKAMAIFKPLNDKEMISILYSNRAVALKNLERYQEALELNQQSIQIDLEMNNKNGLKTSYLNIANLYLKMKNNVKAIEFNNRSLELAKELNSTANIMKAYNGLAKSYHQEGNVMKAFEYSQLHADWKDSLYSQQSAAAIAEMQTKYDTEKKEQEIRLLKEQEKVNQLTNEKYQQYLTFTAAGVVLILITGTLSFLFYNNKKKLALQLAHKNNVIENQRTIHHQLKALSAQMNPHFIFNSLNSIRYFIGNKDLKNSDLFLSKFAGLMRKTLVNSEQTFISLLEELKTLKEYLELEMLRVEEPFKYHIQVKEGVDVDAINIPTLLLQPYVENAIWHGIAQKGKDGKINIIIKEENNRLKILIDDNGIGRSKAKELRLKDHKSYAMRITKTRLNLINTLDDEIVTVNIIDKLDDHKAPSGTLIELYIPLDL